MSKSEEQSGIFFANMGTPVGEGRRACRDFVWCHFPCSYWTSDVGVMMCNGPACGKATRLQPKHEEVPNP